MEGEYEFQRHFQKIIFARVYALRRDSRKHNDRVRDFGVFCAVYFFRVQASHAQNFLFQIVQHFSARVGFHHGGDNSDDSVERRDFARNGWRTFNRKIPNRHKRSDGLGVFVLGDFHGNNLRSGFGADFVHARVCADNHARCARKNSHRKVSENSDDKRKSRN